MASLLEKLSPNPDNPRIISKEQFERLKDKIRRNPDGLRVMSILYKDGVVIAGNQRFRALQELRNEIEVDESWFVDGKDWTDEQIEEFLIISNLSDGQWDWDIIANKWDTEKLQEWGMEIPDQWLDQKEVEEDEAPEVDETSEPVSKLGEVYQLGRHRVMCGDSTKIEDVEKLMDGKKADMVFTDPPYGMFLNADFSGMVNNLDFAKDKGFKSGKKYDNVQGDHDDFDPDFINTIFSVFGYCKEIFLWGANYYSELLLERNKGSWIVWDKRLEESADKMYGSCFELCWSKTKHKQDIARVKWAGVFGTEQEFDHKRHHPTQKPVALSAWFIEKYSKSEQLIADLFLGSGSTLIACEQTNRTCYGMELDPKYCDVIRKRYAKLIGKEDTWEKETPCI